MNRDFWRERRVFITGHTGFKGSWLTQWLKLDGARVTGFSLPPPPGRSLFAAADVGAGIHSIFGDIRDVASLTRAIEEAEAEIVIHLAGQSLVRHSYDDPAATYATNVMGTVNLLEAIRRTATVRTALVVTSDKCYENGPDARPFREDDRLGGRDPYSSSKACAELVVSSYRRSFFDHAGAPRIASARAGNVIGGGDWAADRLVPDLVRAFSSNRRALVRNPDSTRPWQFVLDALHGYRRLIELLFTRDDLPAAWNFGADEARSVRWVADTMAARWGSGATWTSDNSPNPYEALTLYLDSSRAKAELGWSTLLDGATTIEWTVEWYKRCLDNERADVLTRSQIEQFTERT